MILPPLVFLGLLYWLVYEIDSPPKLVKEVGHEDRKQLF